MRHTPNTSKAPTRETAPHVPSKSEIIAALQQDGAARGGLQVEWIFDRFDHNERDA